MDERPDDDVTRCFDYARSVKTRAAKGMPRVGRAWLSRLQLSVRCWGRKKPKSMFGKRSRKPKRGEKQTLGGLAYLVLGYECI